MWKWTTIVRNDRQVPKCVHRSDRNLEEQLLTQAQGAFLRGGSAQDVLENEVAVHRKAVLQPLVLIPNKIMSMCAL